MRENGVYLYLRYLCNTVRVYSLKLYVKKCDSQLQGQELEK